jgi:hypothetical protein
LVKKIIPSTANVTVPPVCNAAFNAPGLRLLTTVVCAKSPIGNARARGMISKNRKFRQRSAHPVFQNTFPAASHLDDLVRVFMVALAFPILDSYIGEFFCIVNLPRPSWCIVSPNKKNMSQVVLKQPGYSSIKCSFGTRGAYALLITPLQPVRHLKMLRGCSSLLG